MPVRMFSRGLSSLGGRAGRPGGAHSASLSAALYVRCTLLMGSATGRM